MFCLLLSKRSKVKILRFSNCPSADFRATPRDLSQNTRLTVVKKKIYKEVLKLTAIN